MPPAARNWCPPRAPGVKIRARTGKEFVRSDWSFGALGFVHVTRDLVDQILLAREGPLVAQAPPELDDQPPSVEVAREAEQEGLHPELVTAVVRIRPDRG